MKRFIAHNQRIKVKNDATLDPNRPTLLQIKILIVLEYKHAYMQTKL